jgi:prepilin-type N-terminal cleavage/methylation domain-containing protein
VIQYFKPRSSSQSQSGFTLIEILVIIIIVAILSAIAAPGWLAFINNRRISTMRGQVADTLRKAQTEAKTTRTMRAVVLDVTASGQSSPRIAIARCVATGKDDASYDVQGCDIDDATLNWQTLGNGDVKPGVVQYTAKTIAQTGGGAIAGRSRLVFDADGVVKATLSGGMPFVIGFGITNPGSTSPPYGTPRCLVVDTLLGNLREGNSTTECLE